MLWPDHCIQGTKGAEFVSALNAEKIERIFRKGTDSSIDSYSGFFDNDHQKSTGLGNYLKEKGASGVYVGGLALDYCVKYTALDAKRLGFRTHVLSDATPAVNLRPEDGDKALAEMKSAGISILQSDDLPP